MRKSVAGTSSEPDAAEPRAGIGSLETGLRLARVLAEAGGAQQLKSIAAATSMSPAKAHRYLVSLIRVGLAEQERASGRYRLGPLALELGLAALRADNLLGVAGEVLADLRDEIDETVMLAVWGNKGPVVVRWEESSRPVATNVRAGWVMPVANSATGRCFAAFLAEGLVAPLLDLTPRERAAFHARLTEIRARGMSRVDGDLLSGVSAIAAPVFQHDGAIAAVIASLGPQRAFDIAWRGRNAIATRAAALRLSKRLGHPVAAAPQR